MEDKRMTRGFRHEGVGPENETRPREVIEDIKKQLQRLWVEGKITEEDWDRIKLMFDASPEERARRRELLFAEGLIDEEINDRLKAVDETRPASRKEVSPATRKMAEGMVAAVERGGIPTLTPSEMEEVFGAYGFNKTEIKEGDPLILMRKLRDRLEESVPAEEGRLADERAAEAGPGPAGSELPRRDELDSERGNQEIFTDRERDTERAAEDFSHDVAEAITSNEDALEAAVDGAAPELPPGDRERVAQELQSESGKRNLARRVFDYLKDKRWEIATGVGVGGVGGAVRTATKAAIIATFGSTLGVGIAAGAAVGSLAGAVAGAFAGGVKEYISERRKVTAKNILERLQTADRIERAAVLAKAEEAYEKKKVLGTEEELAEVADELRAVRSFLETVTVSENTSETLKERLLGILKVADNARKEVPKTKREDIQSLIDQVVFERKKVDRQKVARAALQGAAIGALGGAIGGGVAHWVSGWLHGAGEAAAAKTQTVASEATAAARRAAHQEFLNKKVEASAAATRRVLRQARSEILDQKFKAVAEKGDGATHIARKIAHDYLANQQKLNPDTFAGFSKEQMVYVEDTLQRSIAKMGSVAKHGFRVGDEFTLSGEDVSKALQKAVELEPEKLKSLGELLAQPEHHLTPETVESITTFKHVFDADNHFAEDAFAKAREVAAKAAAQVKEVVVVPDVVPPPPQPSMGEKILKALANKETRKTIDRTLLGLLAGGSALILGKMVKGIKAAERAPRSRGGHAADVLASLGYDAEGRAVRTSPEGSFIGRRSDALDTPLTTPMPTGPVVPQRMPRDTEGESDSETARREKFDQEEFDRMFDTIRSKGVRVEKSPRLAYQDVMECARRIKRVIDAVGTAQLQGKFFNISDLGTEYNQFTQIFYIEPAKSEQEIKALVEKVLSGEIPLVEPPAPFVDVASEPASEPMEIQPPLPQERVKTSKQIFDSMMGKYLNKTGIKVSVTDVSKVSYAIDRFEEITKVLDRVGLKNPKKFEVRLFKPEYGHSAKMFLGAKRSGGVPTKGILNISLDASPEDIEKFIRTTLKL